MQTKSTNAAKSKPHRRWHQFGLRALLIGIALLSFPCYWLGARVREAREQQAAIVAVLKLGGWYSYDDQFDSRGNSSHAAPPGPTWLRSLLGDDFFRSVSEVSLSCKYCGLVTDADVKNLRRFTKLVDLDLNGAQVGDTGLEYIKGLVQLKGLYLLGTQVTDAGLENLRGLTQLEQLRLSDTRVSDAGLENLRGLTKLEQLLLDRTQVTDAGVQRLQRALPMCRIMR